jgi:hypothetical protein
MTIPQLTAFLALTTDTAVNARAAGEGSPTPGNSPEVADARKPKFHAGTS